METLPLTGTETLEEKEDKSRVSDPAGSDPVQTGVDVDSSSGKETSVVGDDKNKGDGFMEGNQLFETEVLVKEVDDEKGVGDVLVGQISSSGSENKKKGKRGRKKKIWSEESENGEKIDLSENGKVGVGETLKKMDGVDLNIAVDSKAPSDEVQDDGNEEVDEEDGGVGDEEHEGVGNEFTVGNLVWVKIKSHPQWPGQVYSPSDASEVAAKYKQNNRLLVACFGDGTFTWCYPAQLKPFQENFDQLVKQSNSRIFVKAVEEAVTEIGRRVDLEMTCSCLSVEDRPVKPEAVNAGITEGVTVPVGENGEFSIGQFKPEEFLAHMKCIAQVASVKNVLELVVIKHRVSAFYLSKGFNQLPEYHEPLRVLVSEDDAVNGLNDEDNVEGQIADRTGSPVEADWTPSEGGPGFGSIGIIISRRRPGILEDKLHQSKKLKSMVEIMARKKSVKGDKTFGDSLHEEGSVSGKARGRPKKREEKMEGSVSGKARGRPKKREEKMTSEVGNDSDLTEVVVISDKQIRSTRSRMKIKDTKAEHDSGVTADGALSGETTLAPPKKRKIRGSGVGNDDDIAKENEINESVVGNVNGAAEKMAVSGTKEPSKKKRTQEFKTKNEDNIGKEQSLSSKQNVELKKNEEFEYGNDTDIAEKLTLSGEQTTKSRKRKANVDSELGNNSGVVQEVSSYGDQVSPTSKMFKKSKLTGPSVTEKSKALDIQTDDIAANEEIKSGASLRERKKSKYLSPPYTNLGQRQRNVNPTEDSKKENPSNSITSDDLDGITRVKGLSTICPTLVKCSGRTLHKELSKEFNAESNASDTSSPPKPNESYKKTLIQEGSVSAHEMLSDFRSAALDPLHLGKKQSDDTIKGFFNKFRSSLYQEGSDFTIYNKNLAGRGSRKRVSFQKQPDSPGKDANGADHPISEGKIERLKRKMKEDDVLESPRELLSEGEPSGKKRKRKEDLVLECPEHAGVTSEGQLNLKGEASVGAILITFIPGVSLPSKDELITTFSRCGALKESETEVIEDSCCAQVVYARNSDARDAYENFEKISNFPSVISYRLCYRSPTLRASENVRNSHQQQPFNSRPAKGGTPVVQSLSDSQLGEVPQLLLVRQSLETTTSMLEKSWDKLSFEVKANLDTEIKSLLNKVTTMVESSSS